MKGKIQDRGKISFGRAVLYIITSREWEKNSFNIFLIIYIALFIFILMWDVAFYKSLIATIALCIGFFFLPERFVVFSFNYFLYTSEKDGKVIEPMIKLLGLSFLLVSVIHIITVMILLPYPPFRYFYRDRFMHPENKGVRDFINEFDSYMRKQKISVIIDSGEFGNPISRFKIVSVDRKSDINQELVEKIRTKLSEGFNGVYIREENNNLKILVPNTYLNL